MIQAALSVAILAAPIASVGPPTPAEATVASSAPADVAEEPCRRVLEQASSALLWCGCDAARLTPRTVAEALAPILWFSSDEPFLPKGFGHGDEPINIPAAFPLDRRAEGAVVYSMVFETDASGRRVDPISGCDPSPTLDMRGLDRLELIYFFYYPADRGVGGHRHDFEKLGLDVRLRTVIVGGQSCIKLSLFQATAYAHALNWMSNRLRLPQGPERAWEDAVALTAWDRAAELSLEMSRERVLPITLLVEEGKHGVCTDRNADGVYNPGYDVNRYVNEAWGLRDNLGACVAPPPGLRVLGTEGVGSAPRVRAAVGGLGSVSGRARRPRAAQDSRDLPGEPFRRPDAAESPLAGEVLPPRARELWRRRRRPRPRLGRGRVLEHAVHARLARRAAHLSLARRPLLPSVRLPDPRLVPRPGDDPATLADHRGRPQAPHDHAKRPRVRPPAAVAGLHGPARGSADRAARSQRRAGGAFGSPSRCLRPTFRPARARGGRGAW